MSTSETTGGKGGFQMPFTLTFEKRVEDIPKWLPVATALGSVVLAFIVSGMPCGCQPYRYPISRTSETYSSD